MKLRLYNAHAHLPNYAFQANQPSSRSNKHSPEQTYSIINGTAPVDWLKVLDFTEAHQHTLPAIGLHPHNIREAPDNWKKTFLELLDSNVVCAIGEIGLDRRDQDEKQVDAQLDAFHWQLEQAASRNLPASIHCVKAIGLLMEALRTHKLPHRGIHLHAYSGPVELISELVELGAYFSFSAKQMDFKNTNIQNRIRVVPTQRLLIETDEMFSNDFSKLLSCYTTIAEIRKMPLEQFAAHIENNFNRYILNR